MTVKNNLNWTHSSLNGLYTRVRMFFEFNRKSEEIVTSSFSSRQTSNTNLNIDNHNIQAAGEGTKENAKLFGGDSQSLTVEIPLEKLGSYRYYKYCLSKQDNKELQINLENNLDCTLKHFDGKNNENIDIEYFFDLITKWINLQHAINVIFFSSFTKPDKIESKELLKPKKPNISYYYQNVSRECGLLMDNSENNYFSTINNLFFSPLQGKKKCFLSPSVLNIWVKSSNDSKNQLIITSKEKDSLKIDSNVFNKGSISGKYIYHLYDYYSSIKKIKLNGNSDKKEISLEINSFPLTLEKNDENRCSFDFLYKKYEEKSLDFDIIKSSCYS
ncbi:hypothetical protein PRV_01200 [Mycoplasma parvum str. Indiana]|uniref:Uncharacterized protein n=2 Tax=Mycoplasma parvum TaxID=984991 RepID=U5NC61_9MOLU|nr:hypothetical protein PRV_01200 [Mycoplasma parvum str. Indiana]